MIRSKQKWLFYGLYTAAVVVFFLYHLFPSKAVEAYIVSAVQKVRPGTTVTIGRISPAFPPGIRASAVSLSDSDALEVSIDHIRITPKLRTLFGSSERVLTFQGRGYDGSITGRMVLGRNRSLQRLHADFADLQIGRMAPVQQLSGRSVTGRISGTVDVEEADAALRMTAALEASDIRIGMDIPGVPVKELTFSEANARLTASNATNLRMESLTAKGRQVNGNLAGAIRLASPYPRSILDLAGDVRPHPSFISELGSSLAVLFRSRGGNNTFPFVVKGTIESPEFLLR